VGRRASPPIPVSTVRLVVNEMLVFYENFGHRSRALNVLGSGVYVRERADDPMQWAAADAQVASMLALLVAFDRGPKHPSRHDVAAVLGVDAERLDELVATEWVRRWASKLGMSPRPPFATSQVACRPTPSRSATEAGVVTGGRRPSRSDAKAPLTALGGVAQSQTMGGES